MLIIIGRYRPAYCRPGQTVAVLTKAEVLRLSQHATKPPRALLPPPPLRYQVRQNAHHRLTSCTKSSRKWCSRYLVQKYQIRTPHKMSAVPNVLRPIRLNLLAKAMK